MNEVILDDVFSSAEEYLNWADLPLFEGDDTTGEDLYIPPEMFSDNDDPENPADDLFDNEDYMYGTSSTD